MKSQILMTTVSSLALTSAGMAVAQDAAPKLDPKFTLTVEGGFGSLDSAPRDKWGASGGLGDKVGIGGNDLAYSDLAYTGAISLSRSIGENRDVRFGLGFGSNPANEDLYTSSYSSGGNSGVASSSVTNNFGFTTMDIDTGRSTELAMGKLSAFGGVRGMVTKSASGQSIDKVGNDGGGSGYSVGLSVDAESSFVGLGPRVGAGFVSKPFAGGFGVSAEVAAGVVYGQRTDRVSLDKVGTSDFDGNFGPVTVGESESNSQIVKTLDAKASVDYHISENTSLSLGYQARQFWNVDGFSDPDTVGGSTHRLVDGAFIAFTTKF